MQRGPPGMHNGGLVLIRASSLAAGLERGWFGVGVSDAASVCVSASASGSGSPAGQTLS
jgi:hypothetical protein